MGLSFVDLLVGIWLVIAAIFGKSNLDIEESDYESPEYESERIKCPQCAELIMKDAKVCRFCGYKLTKE